MCSLSGIRVLAPQVNTRRFKSIYNLPPTFFLANNSVRFILRGHLLICLPMQLGVDMHCFPMSVMWEPNITPSNQFNCITLIHLIQLPSDIFHHLSKARTNGKHHHYLLWVTIFNVSLLISDIVHMMNIYNSCHLETYMNKNVSQQHFITTIIKQQAMPNLIQILTLTIT
jgi:hypothetical protein